MRTKYFTRKYYSIFFIKYKWQILIGFIISLPFLLLDEFRISIFNTISGLLIFGSCSAAILIIFTRGDSFIVKLQLIRQEKLVFIVLAGVYVISIPISIIVFSESSFTNLFTISQSPNPLVHQYFTHLILLLAMVLTTGLFIGISAWIFNISLRFINIFYPNKYKSIVEWLFHRKIKGKDVYQSYKLKAQTDPITHFSRSILLVISIGSIIYNYFYVFSMISNDFTDEFLLESILGIVSLLVIGNFLIWEYYRVNEIIYELGLVEMDKDQELLKKIENSVFNRPIRTVFSTSIVLSALITLTEFPRVIEFLQEYSFMVVMFLIYSYILLLQTIYWFFDSRTNEEFRNLKGILVKKYEIKSGSFDIGFVERKNNKD